MHGSRKGKWSFGSTLFFSPLLLPLKVANQPPRIQLLAGQAMRAPVTGITNGGLPAAHRPRFAIHLPPLAAIARAQKHTHVTTLSTITAFCLTLACAEWESRCGDLLQAQISTDVLASGEEKKPSESDQQNAPAKIIIERTCVFTPFFRRGVNMLVRCA